MFKKMLFYTLMLIVFYSKITFAFVGGFHGGGSSHGGSYHSSSTYRSSGSYYHGNHQSESEELSTIDIFLGLFFLVLIFGYFIMQADDKITERSRKSYLEKCRHAPTTEESGHDKSVVLAATQKLEGRVIRKIIKLNKKYQASYTLDKLKNTVQTLFLSIQDAWSTKNKTAIKRICLSSYCSNLIKQIENLERCRIENVIKDINISECSFIQMHINHNSQDSILICVIRGTLVDEYFLSEDTTREQNPAPRNFNCLMKLSISYAGIFILDIDLNNHPDDAIIEALPSLSKDHSISDSRNTIS